MKNKKKKKFDSVEYFRSIKAKLARRMKGMSLQEQKEFLQKVREGKIELEE